MMFENLNEDIVRNLAAQFNTFPDALRVATDGFVPGDESPSFYMGYISAVMTLGSLLSEQKVAINYDVLVALASKAAILRQGLIAEEDDAAWIEKLNEWLEANYRLEKTGANRH
jgi:hypothetical protein